MAQAILNCLSVTVAKIVKHETRNSYPKVSSTLDILDFATHGQFVRCPSTSSPFLCSPWFPRTRLRSSRRADRSPGCTGHCTCSCSWYSIPRSWQRVDLPDRWRKLQGKICDILQRELTFVIELRRRETVFALSFLCLPPKIWSKKINSRTAK